jgi:lysozyme
MKISNNGLSLIKFFEGFKPYVYLDSALLPTIGIGHLIKKGEQFPNEITLEQAYELLKQDVKIAEASVNRQITAELEQHQFDALVSFTFNLGGGALQRSTLRQRLNRGDYTGAADEFLKWNKAGGRVIKGLVNRRSAERDVFLGVISFDESNNEQF